MRSIDPAARPVRALGVALAAGSLLFLALEARGGDGPVKSHKLTTISLRKAADCLHAVIVADRDAYVAEVAARPGLRGPAPAGVPRHAALLRSAEASIQTRGAEFSYALRSLSPIDPRNGPQTPVEAEGLRKVAADPASNHYVEESLGGRSYFTAIYADVAGQQACVDCHAGRPPRAGLPLKVGDVLGGIVVRLPLEF